MDNKLLEVVLRIKDEATQALKDVNKQVGDSKSQIEGMGKSFMIAGGMMTAGGLAGIAVMKSWVDASAQASAEIMIADASLKNIVSTLDDSTVSFGQLKKEIEKVSQATIKYGVDDETTYAVMVKNIGKTKDMSDAKKLLSAELELAAAKNMDLASAAALVTKAYDGQTTGLMRAGITLAKGTEGIAVADALIKKFSGTAEVSTGTLAVKMRELQIRIENIKEALGDQLLPEVLRIVDALDKFIQRISAISPQFIPMIARATAIATAFGLIVGPILFLIGSLPALSAGFGMLSGAMLVPIAIIASVSAATFLLYKAWTTNFGGIQQHVQLFTDRVRLNFERMKQILSSFGISGEFGGVIAFFQLIETKTLWYSQRIGYIAQSIANFLAFGGSSEGLTANWLNVIDGIWNRMKSFLGEMSPLFQSIKQDLALTGQIIQTQLVPAFSAFMEVLGPLMVIILPSLKLLLMAVAIAIAAVLATVLAVITGILTGLANMLPYVAQAIEGLIQFFRGFIQFLTGIFTRDFGLTMEGIKQMLKGTWDFFVNAFMAILTFATGFIEGLKALFKGLYNYLVGHSVIPDMVNGIIDWFNTLFSKVTSIVANIASNISNVFSGLANSAWNWGKNIITNMINGLKSAIRSSGKLAGKLLGEIGISFSELDQYASGGFVGQTGPAIVHKGEYVMSRDMLAGKTSVPSTVNNNTYGRPMTVNMYNTVNTQVDLDYLAYKLGYMLRNS